LHIKPEEKRCATNEDVLNSFFEIAKYNLQVVLDFRNALKAAGYLNELGAYKHPVKICYGNTQISAKLSQLVGRDGDVDNLEKKYLLEGQVGTYATIPKPVGDQLTPDHQPQASIILGAADFCVPERELEPKSHRLGMHAVRAADHGRAAVLDGGLDLDFHGFTRLFLNRNLLSQPEFDLCQRLYLLIRTYLPQPELIIRLNADVETVARRLSTRDRVNIANAEDTALFNSYLDKWLATISSSQVLALDISNESLDYSKSVNIVIENIRSM
jgi:hypothetical protein